MTNAFVFPGQGSQSVGMQDALGAEFPVVGETYAEASEILGLDLWKLVQDGPADSLNETVNTQPAMLTASVATFRVWRKEGGSMPSILAGHSLGEYTALVAAGALDFGSAVRIVRLRAQLMQEAVPEGEGAMAAVLGLSDEQIQDVCENASGVGTAEPVNFNSPGQIVVAGHRPAIERLIELAKEAGARRAIMLPVSVPSHSSLMRPAGEKLAELLDETVFRAPEVQVVCAVDGRLYGDVDDIRSRIKHQVYSPVRWVDTVNEMISLGAANIIECGPGKVLTGLIKRIDRSVNVACIDTPDALRSALEGANA